MRADRLCLIGFKSFVDRTELTIGPGLTGIVGPNGCGKSNLVEALRWVMGENSARRLRGGEMDDVIFAGSVGRPADNIAEVSLILGKAVRDGPFVFNDRDEIEVARRIERGSGSAYRVNGREVRARDVQLLFADEASGAHSAAMVNQGQVSALIDAKPSERRLLLEEAAGIAGLRSRRHETELKLKATGDNLRRLDDVLATIQAQFAMLKKQARQAERYRYMGEQIRRMEALLLHSRWRLADAEARRVRMELCEAEGAVAEQTEAALAQRRLQQAAESALPPLRLTEAESKAELQRLAHARDGLEHELQRMRAAHEEANRRLAQIVADLNREDDRREEADAVLARLSEERSALARAEAEAGQVLGMTAAKLQTASAALDEAETELQTATEAMAVSDAHRAALERRRLDLTERCNRLRARQAESEREREILTAAVVPAELVEDASAAFVEAERRVGRCRADVDFSEREVAASRSTEAEAQAALSGIEARLTRLKAEAEGLQALLAPQPGLDGCEPLLAAIRVSAGLEAAVGAAFEDELSAPLAGQMGTTWPRYWVDLPVGDTGRLPCGAHPLAEAVKGVPVLARSLAQAGWVDSEETGRRLQPCLSPGQRLVDRDGRMWRWDGYTRAPSSPSAAEQHLRQKNRLACLLDQIPSIEAERDAAHERDRVARAACRRAAETLGTRRQELRDAEAAFARARQTEAEISRRALTAQTRLAAIVDAIVKLTVDIGDVQTEITETERQLTAAPESSVVRSVLDQARAQAAAARRRQAEAAAAVEQVKHDIAARGQRRATIDLEERSWRRRAEDTAAQRADLLARRTAVEREISDLAARPPKIAVASEALGREIAGAAASNRCSAESLIFGERQLRVASENALQADRELARAREQLARLSALQDGASDTLVRITRDIRDRLKVAPEGLEELAGLTADEASPADLDKMAARLDRLMRERDGIGPVNLMAESEVHEISQNIAGLQHERAELTEAVVRLRRGIAALDQEGRQRLTAAFSRVNRDFAALFTRLFGGGNARLALIDDADPLSAGLEIIARPPGKRLQKMSLLSGGEQALTALALIFAVFLGRPAPICVLDEVDAALDDANVDRFCSLVADIADMSGTPFLIVTHHRVTMARADRLFGVTMAERGVSRLVSVDLAPAARLRQTA